MSDLVEHFMRIMDNQPLSLALCVMNLILLFYCFKQARDFAEVRKYTADAIIKWQGESQQIMAHCVSKENLELILAALERDRELYRRMLIQHAHLDSGTDAQA
jgi:hypothetical protein